MPVLSDYSDGTPEVAFCLLRPDGGTAASRGADTAFYSASTIKLAVLLAVLQAVDRGELALETQLAARDTFSSAVPDGGEFGFPGDEADPGMPAGGTEMSLAAVLDRMITVSSNAATNMAVDLVGFDAVNRALAGTGAASSFMQRYIGDLAALEAGLTHQVTAADLARTMHSLICGKVLGPESTEFALGLLARQEFAWIAAGLAPDTVQGSKSGWVTGISHDVAFFAPAGTPLQAPLERAWVLAVCTRGYEADAGQEIIAAVAGLAAAVVGPEFSAVVPGLG
ncbi:serine hydrolase [Arthrobacter sp. BL-252-APC-1A]|uniref:serine hydrolase n=1 Tax=Arthrobacter sp. BL-252-APC-1A TaxID=2606622 RepID=UPI0012B206D4|nr:serine hydrolase [Arthrobacter sp. BL-252-APC-1A]MSR98492.1 serine hydrolase [Arthrobacter sp. BL-252-APC-1A]